MAERSVENFKLLLGSAKFLFIDEAQNITNIGSLLKLLIQYFDERHGENVFYAIRGHHSS